MRTSFLSCIMAVSLAFGLCEAAVAQSRGPPAAAQSVGDIARQQELIQRADALVQALSGRQDGQGAQMLSQARSLQARLRGGRNLSDSELDAVDAALARLESAAG